MNRTLDVTTPSAREVAISRSFDAPRRLVFDAFTKPHLVKRWLWAPDDWPMVECEIDLRVGGALLYKWRHKEKGDMVMRGVFREIAAPKRVIHTELFEQDWTGGETLVTADFTERDGRTAVTMTVLYSSQEARDAALKTGMTDGMAQTYGRLDKLLAGSTEV